MSKEKENRLPGGNPTDGKKGSQEHVIYKKKYSTVSGENQQVLRRAVKIAARVLNAAGLCRYDSVDKCHRLRTDDTTCEKCIERWLLTKARKELQDG